MIENKENDKVFMERNKLQEKSLQLILLDQDLRKIEEQYKLIEQSIANIEMIKANLDEIKKLKENNEIFASLSDGIFIKARMEKPDKIFINVGKGIVLEKPIDKAKEILDARIEELSLLKSVLSGEAQRLLDEIRLIEEEVKKLVEKSK